MAEVPDAFNEAVEEYLDKRKIRWSFFYMVNIHALNIAYVIC
jgi:hypothetical protein